MAPLSVWIRSDWAFEDKPTLLSTET